MNEDNTVSLRLLLGKRLVGGPDCILDSRLLARKLEIRPFVPVAQSHYGSPSLCRGRVMPVMAGKSNALVMLTILLPLTDTI